MSARNAIVLLPSELRAILEHKQCLSLQRGRPVSIDEAIEDFVRNYRKQWLQEKYHRDIKKQIQEMEKHLWCHSEQADYDIGRGATVEEWIRNYAAAWRATEESLEGNGFLTARLVLKKREGLITPVGPKLGKITLLYDSDIYVHWRGMHGCSFIMNEKEYLDVKSPCFLHHFNADGEDVAEIEVIATGAEAMEVIDSIRCLAALPP